MIVVLAGGVGAAKFLSGLVKVIDPKELFIIVNTGDDIELFGLKISPDLDIITYTLGNVVHERGWGRAEETFNFLDSLKDFGYKCWFNLGDRDLATHVFRTELMKKGASLSRITELITRKFNIGAKIVPMTNHSVPTLIKIPDEIIHFEEYMIERGAKDPVLDVIYENVEKAEPCEGIINAIKECEGIIICPSNPLVSINTILSINGIKDAIISNKKKVIGITPIIGSSPVKGPLDKLMEGLGLDVSAFGVARYYEGLINAFIIDTKDEDQREKIENLGMKVFVTNTLMSDLQIKKRLAQLAVDYIKSK